MLTKYNASSRNGPFQMLLQKLVSFSERELEASDCLGYAACKMVTSNNYIGGHPLTQALNIPTCRLLQGREVVVVKRKCVNVVYVHLATQQVYRHTTQTNKLKQIIQIIRQEADQLAIYKVRWS